MTADAIVDRLVQSGHSKADAIRIARNRLALFKQASERPLKVHAYMTDRSLPYDIRAASMGHDVTPHMGYLWDGSVPGDACIAPAYPRIRAAYEAAGKHVLDAESLIDPPEARVTGYRRVIIASCGPSLQWGYSAVSPLTDDDLVIGLNAAVYTVPCDWWIALDGHSLYRERNSNGRPALGRAGGLFPVICRGMPRQIHGAEGQWVDFSMVTNRPGGRLPEDHGGPFTICAAIVLAAALKPERIEIIGADMSCAPGVEGRTRDHSRWSRERPYFDARCEAATAEGITVRRLLPGALHDILSRHNCFDIADGLTAKGILTPCDLAGHDPSALARRVRGLGVVRARRLVEAAKEHA